MTDQKPVGLDTLGSLLKAGLGDRLSTKSSSFLDMLADDVVLEFPFAADEPRRLEGLATATSFMKGAAGTLKVDEMVLDKVHAVAGDAVVILEFHADGKSLVTGNPYNQKYIAVVTTADGLIRHYKSYFNPLVVLESAGRLPPLT